MSDSSSSSEDENADLLREAADTLLINDDLFKSGLKEENKSTTSTGAAPEPKSTDKLKSERYLEFTEHYNDLSIPKSMQDFVYKKLSQNIDKIVEFVDVEEGDGVKKKKKNKKVKPIVKLLNDTDPIEHLEENVKDNFDFSIEKKKKPEIKRRIIEADDYSDEAKWKLSAVDGDSIVNGDHIKCWKKRKNRIGKYFEYREVKNVLYLKEPENEFTAQRKKNNWVESKISKWKKK